MSSLNKVMLIGRLGRDPETRYTSGGKAVCNFSMATDEKRGGEKQTTWHNIVIWERQAELAQQYLHKGSLVYVEGRIQLREYETKDGSKKTAYEIVCNSFRMLDKRESAVGETKAAEASDDDIPF